MGAGRDMAGDRIGRIDKKRLGALHVGIRVEDDGQLTFLNAYGCNYGQGYLFGRPLAPEQPRTCDRAEASVR